MLPFTAPSDKGNNKLCYYMILIYRCMVELFRKHHLIGFMKHNEIILRNKYFYNEVPKTFDRGCIIKTPNHPSNII